jgi:hypothetical protein
LAAIGMLLEYYSRRGKYNQNFFLSAGTKT